MYGGYMNPTKSLFCNFRIAIVAMFFLFSLSSSAYSVNVIAGFVFDKVGQAIPDIDIELLDEYERTVPNGRQKTSPSGRYEFQVNNNGRYFIKVYAFRYDLMDEKREVVVGSITATSTSGGSSYNTEDFYLQPKKGGLRDAELSVIFAQDIPKEAKAAYDDGISKLAKKQTAEGYIQLKKAIDIFPKYFNALYRYGIELMLKNQFQEAAYYFFKAADVNPKSPSSYFNLAICLDTMGPDYRKAALVAIGETLKMAPASAGANLLAGKIERETGDFASSEKHLLQAKKLSSPPDPQVYKELAQLYSNNLKKYKEAADELESFIKTSKITGDEETKMRAMVAGLREKAKSQTGN